METTPNPFQTIGQQLGISASDAQSAASLFLTWLTNSMRDYEGLNGDFIGERLHWQLSRGTYYHLLGLLDEFSGKYSWEPGSASQYLLRIAPRDEWPDPYDSEVDSPKADPSSIAKGMTHLGNLAGDDDFSISLQLDCDRSRLFLRLRVCEEDFMTADGFTMVDFVPVTPEDLLDLIGREPHDMLVRIQRISKGRDCILTTRGEARWGAGVSYPHT